MKNVMNKIMEMMVLVCGKSNATRIYNVTLRNAWRVGYTWEQTMKEAEEVFIDILFDEKYEEPAFAKARGVSKQTIDVLRLARQEAMKIGL